VAQPLKELHKSGVVGAEAHVFARNRGLSLLVRADNPLAIHSIENLKKPDARIIMASADEPGARSQYISALKVMLGGEATESILMRETGMFPVNLVGSAGKVSGVEAGTRLLAQRPLRPDLAPDPRLPDDSRLWAALQNASGGTWAGCVYDVDVIVEALAAGGAAKKEKNE